MLRPGLFLCRRSLAGAAHFRPSGRRRASISLPKFAAIEARWHDEQPASEVIIAIPDEPPTNRYELRSRARQHDRSMSTTSKEVD
jgi:cytochrome d ubiquinol oxidase subunit I